MGLESQSHIPFPTTGPYPVRAGNRVRPLIDPGPTFRRIGEAVEAASQSVWVTIAFIALDFAFPDERGTVFDLLDRAARRGLDVRVLFWHPSPETAHYPNTFAASPANRALLAKRDARFRARWDTIDGTFCHHQKSWIIDAGQAGETAFIGGNNLTFGLCEPGHAGIGERHDIYVEVAGPAATDVHHNFVQRWNEASERLSPEGSWAHTGDDDLPFPTVPSKPRGTSLVQMQRTIRAGRYRADHAAPGGPAWNVAAGERTVLAQYELAIAAARRTIYIENQALPIPEIGALLDQALRRGVSIAMVVPAEAAADLRANSTPARDEQRRRIAALQEHPAFTMVALAGRAPTGDRAEVYVHSKIMLVDDAWATVGSCNLHANSLFGHSELNASFWDPAVVRSLRCTLLGEHIALDTSDRNDGDALALFRRVAQENRRLREAGNTEWQGLAYAL